MAGISKNLNVQLTATSSDFTKKMKEAEDTAKGFGKTVRDAIGGLSGIGLASLGISFIRDTLADIWKTLSHPIELAADMEEIRITMEVFTQSAEAAEEVISRLQDRASQFGLNSEKLAEMANKFLGLGLGIEDTTKYLKQLGAIAGALNRPIETLVQNFARVFTRGKVDPRVLIQWGQMGIRIKEAIGKAMGTTLTSEVESALKHGQVDFKTFAKALEIMTSEGGQFFGIAQKRAAGMKGLDRIWTENMKQIMEKVGEAATEGLGLHQWKRAWDDALIWVNSHVKQYLVPVFHELAEFTKGSWRFFRAAWDEWGAPVVAQVEKWFRGFGEGWNVTEETALNFWESMSLSATNVLGELKKFAGHFLTNWAAPLIEGLSAVFDWLIKVFGKFAEWGQWLKEHEIQVGQYKIGLGYVVRPMVERKPNPEGPQSTLDYLRNWGNLLSQQGADTGSDWAKNFFQGLRDRISSEQSTLISLAKRMKKEVSKPFESIRGPVLMPQPEMRQPYQGVFGPVLLPPPVKPKTGWEWLGAFGKLAMPKGAWGDVVVEKLAPALVQGSKEAYSAIVAAQYGGGRDAMADTLQKQLDAQDETNNLLRDNNKHLNDLDENIGGTADFD